MSAFCDEAPSGDALPRTRRRAQADPLEGGHGAGLSRPLDDEVAPGRLSLQRTESHQLHSRLIHHPPVTGTDPGFEKRGSFGGLGTENTQWDAGANGRAPVWCR